MDSYFSSSELLTAMVRRLMSEHRQPLGEGLWGSGVFACRSVVPTTNNGKSLCASKYLCTQLDSTSTNQSCVTSLVVLLSPAHRTALYMALSAPTSHGAM